MRTLTIVEALKQAIREEMLRDERVFCIGEDIGTPGGWGEHSRSPRACPRSSGWTESSTLPYRKQASRAWL